MRLIALWAAALLAMAAFAKPGQATSVLEFRIGTGNITFTAPLTGGDLAGTVARFENPVRDTGTQSFFGTGGDLSVGSGSFVRFFDATFDRDVNWIGGTTRVGSIVFDGFDVLGPGVNVTALLAGVPRTSDFTLPNPLTFRAGQSYSFAAVNTNTATPVNTGAITFPNWTFAKPTEMPEPGAGALFLAGVIGLAFSLWGASSVRPRKIRRSCA